MVNKKVEAVSAVKPVLAGVVAILPALNELEGIPLVIDGLKEQGITDIVVIDGGSTDGTPEVARSKGATVMPQQGKGKGAAFRTFVDSYPLEDSSVYVMLDADASYLPSDAPALVQKINQGYDVSSGCRKVLIYGLTSFIHALGGKLISLFASGLFFLWHPDVTTGYWAFSGRALKKMQLTSNGFDLEADLFAQTAKKGLSFATVRVDYQKRVGQAKLSYVDAFKIVLALLKYRF